MKARLQLRPVIHCGLARKHLEIELVAQRTADFDDLVRILSEEFEIDLPDAFFDPNVWEIDGSIMSQDLGFDPVEMDAWMDFVIPFGNVAPDINTKWRSYFDVSGLHVAQAALGLDINPSADLSSGKENIDNF